MTPKEKAIELLEKINNELNWIEIDYQIDLYRDVKQCALIAVDEIIESNPYKLSLEGKFLTEHITYDINFWKEVKKEIEKI
jgi:hypothetical protein